MVKFPCPICEKTVATNYNTVCNDMCDCWIHIPRNNIGKQTYRQSRKDPSLWYRKSCLKKEIPFSNLNNGEIEPFNSDSRTLTKKRLHKPRIFE